LEFTMNERPVTTKRTLLLSAAQLVAGSVAGLSHAQPVKDKHIAASRTGWVYDDAYLTPVFEPSHPERPQRVQAIAKAIRDSALNSQLELLNPQSVRASEVDAAIKLIHTQTHIDSLRAQYSAPIVDLARLAVAGCLVAVDAVMTERVRNVFVCSRPPGHHARNTGREEGFCFYNHVAIAARYLQKRYGVQRVLIVDWDYHHGDGTEHFFYEDGSVMLFNTYDHRAYPGVGDPARKGAGAGTGMNINVPLSCGTDDNQIRRAFEQQLIPAADRFKPDFILISAGFDSRVNDLLGCFQISDEGFVTMTKIVMALAERHCKGRVVSVLEGGYNLAGLASVALAHVGTLANYRPAAKRSNS
jgi:acetoin utilization deacetylase AcuC-like enzyme